VSERLDMRDGRHCHPEHRPPFDDIFNVPEFEYGTPERATGIEPAFSAWEADVLPLNYARSGFPHYRVGAMVFSGERCGTPRCSGGCHTGLFVLVTSGSEFQVSGGRALRAYSWRWG
jgi:hypothetical protein